MTKKMGRPTKDEEDKHVIVNISLPFKLVEKLNEMVNYSGASRSKLVKDLINKGLGI